MCASGAKDNQECRSVTTSRATQGTGPTTDHVAAQPGIRYLGGRMSGDPRKRPQEILPKAWILAAFVAFPALGGCAAEPFVDGRREAGTTRPIGPSTADRVAICYNSRGTTPEQVWRLAESECAKTDRVPQYESQDALSCSLVNPTRIFFRCVAAGA